MSRSAHQRQQQKLQMQQQQLLAQQMADNEAAAAAAEMFDLFCVATTMRQVLGLHRQMCDVIGLRPAPLNEFYPKLKTKIRSWKAQALWKKFDARAAHRAYAKGNACTGTRVLVIGAGPCGLRTAIEAQLLGAKVVVIEKRDRISRNNVLHLWPFVITDLRNLGAKKFYGKFCAGSIDHISIRQLQCILLKVALLLGVEVHEGVSFDRSIEPSGDGCGWRAQVSPEDHAVSHYEFDVLIGADGKRNTLEGFKRKEFRGKLAIAITANFINKKTEAEAKAEEISGVAFIFNQSFFKELYHTTGIDLENIVYYKDETHYFVMTAKKHSLIDKGVIMQDFADPAELLAPVNVNTEKLLDYAREAAEFSTKYQMPNLEFAVNHYGKPDVAMFDFTSMFAAESSCRVIVRHGFRLLQCLVGDSLLEPFWPTGSGCARGFLSSMDAAYALKLWSNPANSTLGVMAQRESIYRLLGQTTPENLQRDIGSYTVDPATRYPNLNRSSVNVWQVKHLIDTDDKTILEQTFMDTNVLQVSQVDTPVRRKRRSGDTMPLSAVLLRWICAQLHSYEFTKDLKEASDVFANGKVLCALINRYRPDLVDFNAVKDLGRIEMNDLAFQILDKELHIPSIMTGKDSIQLNTVESKVWLNYLEQICEVFRGEIPHVKHPKVDFSDLREKYRSNYTQAQPDFSKLLQLSSKQKAKSPIQDAVDVPQVVQRRSVLDEEKLKRQRKHEQLLASNAASAGHTAQTDTPRRAKKRRSAEKAAHIEERQKRLQEIEANRHDRLSKRRQQRYQQTQNFYKSLHMLQANNLLREGDENSPFEDYSIFLYRQQAPEFNDRVKELERKLLHPDRERGDIQSAFPRSNLDEQFSDRIKSMEQRISSRNNYGNDKKPKDLMRAIGKIDSNDWNVREIEKKIEQSKKTEVHGPKGREKVPKWSREQFQARQNKMAKPQRQDSSEEKFKEIDQTLKTLDKQLKEGSVLEVGERGRNKVASIAGQFKKRDDKSEEKNPPTVASKSSTKVALAFKKQAASEKCHFCHQIVYLMEKFQTENLVMHRGCLKCHHCHTNLRLGAYAFDRDDPNGRFYCTQHFRLPAKPTRPVVRKPGQRKPTQQQQNDAAAAAVATEVVDSRKAIQVDPSVVQGDSDDEPKTPEKRGPVDNVTKLDLLERGQTPERIEFENTDAMSDGEPSEEHIIDEHEWSGRNFLPESNNDSESDLSSSDESDNESDSDIFEEANDSPLGAQTLQLASEWIGKQNYSDSDDTDEFYDSSEGLADDGKDDTEGEEFEKARELRREEVRLPPLPPNLPTDTETESKLTTTTDDQNDTLKNEILKPANSEKLLDNNNKKDETEQGPKNNDNNQSLDLDSKNRKGSDGSANSEQSFKSTSSLPLTNGITSQSTTTKADIEKLEQNSERKFSAEIDAISEKLYRLNNVVKMNKDIETIAKENLIRSDILKKLNMKEKWLADKQIGVASPIVANTKFEEKVDKILQPTASPLSKSKFNDQTSDPYAPKSQFKDMGIAPGSKLKGLDDKQSNDEQIKKDAINLEKQRVLNEKNNLGSVNVLQQIKELINKENVPSSTKKPPSRSNSFKSNASNSSPLAKPKSATNVKQIENGNKMEIENILNIVKNIEISKSEKSLAKDKNQTSDMGKLLYKVEAKFSPKPNKKMSEKLKEIEAKNFSGTLDSIKSQMEMPTVSAQTVPPNVDLSKYFPNQKLEKSSTSNINKNQKALNEIDLTKYFPSSPVPQRRASVVTVADRLKKSQTDKSLDSTLKAAVVAKETEQTKDVQKHVTTPLEKNAKQFSLHDNQLDGAIDIVKKKPASKVVTTTAVATTGKKGKNVKIVKKVVRKGSISKSKAKKSTSTRDNDDMILDEILNNSNEELRSPSLEYQQLFNEEKSPSEDISDKIELILEETGIDLGIAKKTASAKPNQKKLLKAKSLGEGEMQFKKQTVTSQSALLSGDNKAEEEDLPSGVQNILKRFESMSSMPGDDHSFKLRRMESTTSNLNKSKESIVSRESESFSDLEKTMEYLKSEWKNEATNFLQKKRNDYNISKKKSTAKAEAAENPIGLINSNPETKNSKFAKFFGLKQKSPEKKKSPIRKKISSERRSKDKSPHKNTPNNNQSAFVVKPENVGAKTQMSQKEMTLPKTVHDNKPIIYASLEELALIKVCEDKPKPIEKPIYLLSKKDEIEHKQDLGPPVSEDAKEEEKVQATPVTKPMQEEEFSPKLPSVEDITHILEIATPQGKLSAKRPSVEDMLYQTKPVQEEDLSAQLPLFENMPNDQKPVAQEDELSIKRPLVEDIRNLPKTGCDKSLSSSRRGSITSLQSRRLSNTSNTERIETAIEMLNSQISSDIATESSLNKTIMLNENYDEDSLCTSISKSPSIPPVTVQLRGSSEDESIENLFSQFSDDMLVNVEFDSNDELIEIIPVEEEKTDQDSKDTNKDEANNDTNNLAFGEDAIVKYTSEESHAKPSIPVPTITADKLHVPLKTITVDSNFPMRPQRRQKSTSSSSDSVAPLAPQRIKKKLSKISPSDMPPSVQDLMQEVYKFNEHPAEDTLTLENKEISLNTNKPLRFPRLIDEDDILLDEIPIGNKMFSINAPKTINTQQTKTVISQTQQQPIVITSNILNDGFKYRPNNLENVNEFTKVLTPIQNEQDNPATEEDVKGDDVKKSNLSLKDTSADWNMEMLPNSPMPRHKNIKNIAKLPSVESLTGSDKLDWNMEMLPNSPMPRRKSSTIYHEVQSESESSSSGEIEPNSATEISTDSEFDNDEMIRGAPKIIIDDTHLRKPTKVQIKSTIIPPSVAQKSHQKAESGGTSYLAKYQLPPAHAPIIPQFKPLVQVDPSLLTSNRTPLQNPRPGDYLLNKTASTEGIASKKSLELKKRYLLGEPANGNKIQKSGSTSVLDSRIRSFQSNISECQKLLNPSNDISASMKTFLDRTKLSDKSSQDLIRSATNNILNDLKVEITIQKASSTASTDNEKENVFVNSKNELNKCLEYTETVNSALLESVNNKKSPTTPTNNKNIIETIDLITPEKEINRDNADSNRIIDLTVDSPEKSNRTISDNVTKPDISKDTIQCIPDILGHIEQNMETLAAVSKQHDVPQLEEESHLLENNIEKTDAPEKVEDHCDNEMEDVQIEVPNIAWNVQKSDNLSLSSNSSCSSHSSSLEDIEHYILESTTSPDTHNSAIAMASSSSLGSHQVPRVEVHDSSGTLMQIDSLMIIDGKYIGDPEDLKFMELPEGIIVPEQTPPKTLDIDDNHEVEADQEPITATPEPMEATVIEVPKDVATKDDIALLSTQEQSEEQPPPLPENGPPLPEKGPPKVKPSNLKFDSKNENKIESLKNLPLIVDTTTVKHTKAVKPISLNLNSAQTKHKDMQTPQQLKSPQSPLVDMDKTPTGDLLSRGSDSETEPTGTTQNLTETELSDWTADDCISENFIDMDFVNKATTTPSRKRGKKKSSKESHSARRLPSTNELMQEVAKTAPVAEFEGILKSIDLDDIEFMDTGSDSSSTEPHSATNTALLRNRGYVEFVEQTTPKHVTQGAHSSAATSITVTASDSFKLSHVKRDEKLGVDYIEQGAYLLHDDANKTPVNESAKGIGPLQTSTSSAMTQSLTDSSTINDIEDDSTNSQLQLSSTTTTTAASKVANPPTATTEESDALTVVSSPLDLSSPFTRFSSVGQKQEFEFRENPTDCISTPSSSDRAPKTSQSTSRSNSGTTSSKNTPPRQSSKDSSSILLPGDRRSNEELSYEEYVRALQQKIVQISTTARGDSLDAKKQRRKGSKGDTPSQPGAAFVNSNQTVIETTTPTNLRYENTEDEAALNQTQMGTKNITTPMTASQQQLNKVPEIPTLTRKLEEITKERTKQKDLIHDLVMDKLQSKKQLNAEKRLHRSRQRSILTSGVAGNASGNGCGYSSASSLSPTPKLAAANSISDNNCTTSQAHYHVSTAAVATSPSARTAAATQRFLNNSSSFKENSPSSVSYVSAYGVGAISPNRMSALKQRPFSEHLELEKLPTFDRDCKINKTPSFSYTSGAQNCGNANDFNTPVRPLRQNRLRQAAVENIEPSHNVDSKKDLNFSTSTENLRTEARARARLKSNSELGLSPEEKMQLLRKRILAEGTATTNDDLSGRQIAGLRETKMSSSKSVNDLAFLTNSQKKNLGPATDSVAVKVDFTSDPNILLSTKHAGNSSGKMLKTNRRCKDPERRKSLIQSLSNFFHMGQQGKDSKMNKDTATVCDGNSAQPEHPGTGCSGGSGGSNSGSSTSHPPISGIDGVLSRFRISPKSKEKSKNNGEYTDGSGSSPRRMRTSSVSLTTLSYECHKNKHHSQVKSPRSHLGQTPFSHSQLLNCLSYNSNNINHSCKHPSSSQRNHPIQNQNIYSQRNHHHGSSSFISPAKKSSSSSALAYSSSSPQLCAHKSQSMTNTNQDVGAYDDQTPPPIPPLPLNYQRSDDESYTAESRDQKKQRAISKAVRQAELKRLRIAQEIQREQEEIEVQLKELETRGVFIEKALRGEVSNSNHLSNVGCTDDKLLKELLEIWRNITQLKKRDEELGIRQQELQLEHRHAQLKEELNMRLSSNKLDKSSSDVAAEGAILNEMLEIVAKRAALRPSSSSMHDLAAPSELLRSGELASCSNKFQLSSARGQSNDIDESNI